LRGRPSLRFGVHNFDGLWSYGQADGVHCITVWYDAIMAKTITAIRLEPRQLAELEKIAKREDRAVSYIIRKAIDLYIKKGSR